VAPFPHFLLVDLGKCEKYDHVSIKQGYTQDTGYFASEVTVYCVDDVKNPVFLAEAKGLSDNLTRINLKPGVGRKFLLVGVRGPGPRRPEVWANRVWAVKEVSFRD
jgi:hypothetical protein